MQSSRVMDGDRYRPRSSTWLTGGAWLFLVGLLAAQLAAEGLSALRLLPVLLLVGYLAWCALWHPTLCVGDDGVRLVNPFRTIVVPWAALIDVRTQFALTLVTPHGSYPSWAATGPGRHRALSANPEELSRLPSSAFDHRGAVRLSELPGAGSGAAAELVRRRWSELIESDRVEAGIADEVPVQIHWDVPALVLTAVLVVASVLALAL